MCSSVHCFRAGCLGRGEPAVAHGGGPSRGQDHLLVLQPALQVRSGDLHDLVQHPAARAQRRAVAAALPAVRRAPYTGRGGRPRHRPRPHHLHGCGRQAAAHPPLRHRRCLPGHAALQCPHHWCVVTAPHMLGAVASWSDHVLACWLFAGHDLQS